MFSHRSIHKYTWTSPDGQTHNQVDHVLKNRRQHSSILDVRYFRGADSDTDHYLVAAKIRERLAVSKRPVNKMDMVRFNLKKLKEGEVKEQYQVKIKNRFSALENLEVNGDISRAWDAIKENTKICAKECIGHCEAKRHKPWFDEECSKLVDRRKQPKLQWLQDPSVVNEGNLSNIRREASRHFRNKKNRIFEGQN
jgi:DNA repair ATPase RecN